jgi:hypothetical protein
MKKNYFSIIYFPGGICFPPFGRLRSVQRIKFGCINLRCCCTTAARVRIQTYNDSYIGDRHGPFCSLYISHSAPTLIPLYR